MEAVYFGVFVWLLLAMMVGFVGVSRGRNGLIWFGLSLLISPALVFVLVLVLPNRINGGQHFRDEDNPPPILQTHAHCPECLELVSLEAEKCTYCGRALNLQERTSP